MPDEAARRGELRLCVAYNLAARVLCALGLDRSTVDELSAADKEPALRATRARFLADVPLKVQHRTACIRAALKVTCFCFAFFFAFAFISACFSICFIHSFLHSFVAHSLSTLHSGQRRHAELGRVGRPHQDAAGGLAARRRQAADAGPLLRAAGPLERALYALLARLLQDARADRRPADALRALRRALCAGRSRRPHQVSALQAGQHWPIRVKHSHHPN